jgi:hypothetical protein
MSATNPSLPRTVRRHFDDFDSAMQPAEEMAADLSVDDYITLMQAIVSECEQRMTNCYLANARSKGLTLVPAPNRENPK